MLIALCGYPGSGKDEVAKILVDHYGYQRVAFADPIRAAFLAGNQWIKVGDNCFRKLKEIVDAIGWDEAKRLYPEIREGLQLEGTEGGREIHGWDCWLNIAERKLSQSERNVITDMRFENEVDFCNARGSFNLHVIRPGVGKVNNHSSEQMDYAKIRHGVLVNDGDLLDLRISVGRFMGETYSEFVQHAGQK